MALYAPTQYDWLSPVLRERGRQYTLQLRLPVRLSPDPHDSRENERHYAIQLSLPGRPPSDPHTLQEEDDAIRCDSACPAISRLPPLPHRKSRDGVNDTDPADRASPPFPLSLRVKGSNRKAVTPCSSPLPVPLPEGEGTATYTPTRYDWLSPVLRERGRQHTHQLGLPVRITYTTLSLRVREWHYTLQLSMTGCLPS